MRLIRPAIATGCGFTRAAPGVGRDRVTTWLFFSSVIVRASTERKYQPEAASPTWRRVRLFVVWLSTSATFCGLPIAVPTSVKGGRSGSAGGGGASATGTGGADGAGGAGGRRDAEKSGRSCVTESELTGIPHSGLPPGGGCRNPDFWRRPDVVPWFGWPDRRYCLAGLHRRVPGQSLHSRKKRPLPRSHRRNA